MNLEELFAMAPKMKESASKEQVEKTASETSTQSAESMEKIASELYAGGQIFAEGFADRLIEKLAGSGVPPAGAGIKSPRSGWEETTKKIEALATRKGPKPSGGSVTAEGAGALSGATGVVNSGKPLV